jgi:hypothetical protein
MRGTLCPYAGAPRAVLGARKEGEVVDLNVTTAIPWGGGGIGHNDIRVRFSHF